MYFRTLPVLLVANTCAPSSSVVNPARTIVSISAMTFARVLNSGDVRGDHVDGAHGHTRARAERPVRILHARTAVL